MWNKPWKFAEGIAIGAGLLFVGLMLQFTIGPIDWKLLAWPLNIILLIVYVLVLGGFYAVRKRIYVVEWSLTMYAAVPAIVCGVLVTLIMAISGWDSMLRAWPFVMIYIWLMNILGLTILLQISTLFHHFSLTKFAALISHLGLFLAMVCGTLGHADMMRLKLTAQEGESPEWRAIDEDSHKMPPEYIELPLAIELHDFLIEEYPPKYVVIDNETGQVIQDAPYDIKVDSLLDQAAMVMGAKDSLGHQDINRYIAWPSQGACTAAHITVTASLSPQPSSLSPISGWVSCGSFMFPYKALTLNNQCSVVMPDREPKRFASEVTIYTESGKKQDATIEVNHPLDIEGWKIYQLSYDNNMGRWSETSVFELVRDPWLPWVYTGIFMLLGGAVLFFITGFKAQVNTETKTEISSGIEAESNTEIKTENK